MNDDEKFRYIPWPQHDPLFHRYEVALLIVLLFCCVVLFEH